MFNRFCITEIVKNEEKTVPWFLDNIAFLQKFGLGAIFFTDTGSTDQTPKIIEEYAKNYVVPVHLHHTQFVDFGISRTDAMRRATSEFPWILLIDVDEMLYEAECEGLQSLLSADTELWYLPRKKWGDLERKKQVQSEFYPDWQGALVRNIPQIHYHGRVHEMITGHRGQMMHQGALHKHHFEPCFRTATDLTRKYKLYRSLGKGPVMR